MKKFLVIFIVALVGIAAMTQIDDNLSAESTELIERIDPSTQSEAYLYFLGISASEDEDPIAVGRRLFEEYQRLGDDENYQVSEYPDAKKLPLPTGNEFCKRWEKGCLATMFSGQFDVQSLLEKHKTLVARVDTFFSYDEYKTLSKPTPQAVIPEYQYLSTIERLRVLEAISYYKKGDAAQAIEKLMSRLSILRKAMELQDNLIGKLILIVKLSEIVDVMSVMLSSTNVDVPLIPPLSQPEKSFHQIVTREFLLGYYYLEKLDRNPHFFDEEATYPGWAIRAVYKPNMTINAIASMYYRLEALAQLTPAEFAKQVGTYDDGVESTSALRNVAGNILLDVASLQMSAYVARFNDLDVKFSLFNQRYHLKRDSEAMNNPYYGIEKPTENNGRVCFTGPVEDKQSLRCLPVTLTSEQE